MPHLFTSLRLGFRNWTDADLQPFAEMNADPAVMEFFPSTLTEAESLTGLRRYQEVYDQKGYTYFAVDELDSGQCIGFIGLYEQTFKSEFTPCVDIGWRLRPTFWGNGYATEGATRCLEFAFETLKLDQVRAFAPAINRRSIHVMEKIGMKKIGQFLHPRLKGNARLQHCVCYEISRK